VDEFYKNFCTDDGSKGAGLTLPHTCGLAYQYSVINPGRPDIGVLRQALRYDLRLLTVCGVTSWLDQGEHAQEAAWFTLALGLDEVMREGFNPRLVEADETDTEKDPLAKLSPSISASGGDTTKNTDEGTHATAQPDTPPFDYKLSVMIAVLHKTSGLQDACLAELSGTATGGTRQNDRKTTVDDFSTFPCTLMIGSILWNVHLCDVGSADADAEVAKTAVDPGSSCHGGNKKPGQSDTDHETSFGLTYAALPNNDECKDSDHPTQQDSNLSTAWNYVYGTLNAGNAKGTNDFDSAFCAFIKNSTLKTNGQLKQAYKEVRSELDDYLKAARIAYMSGHFTAEDMGSAAARAFADLGMFKLTTQTNPCDSKDKLCFGSTDAEDVLSFYRRLLMIHEVIQAANGQDYKDAIAVLTRAVCIQQPSSGLVTGYHYDGYERTLAPADTAASPLIKESVGEPLCRLLYIGQDVIVAQNSADLEIAAEDFGSTEGSWRFKSANSSLWTISGVLSVDYEEQRLDVPNEGASHIYQTTVFAPVGVELTWNWGEPGYYGAMLTLIDVGKAVQTGGGERVGKTQVATNTGLSFAQVWSPGLVVFHTFPAQSPFVFGLGYNYVPHLRTATTGGNQAPVSGRRLMLFFGVDAALWPL